MLWQTELRPHAAGEFSMAAAQANAAMEDQAQVLASPSATLVGVYDGHGGADASRFLRSQLFPHVQRACVWFAVYWYPPSPFFPLIVPG
jgi:pyruvate dehydrogenase phosphatase